MGPEEAVEKLFVEEVLRTPLGFDDGTKEYTPAALEKRDERTLQGWGIYEVGR